MHGSRASHEDEEPQDDFLGWLLPDIPLVPGEEDADDKENNDERAGDFHEGIGDLAGMLGIHSDVELVEIMLL